MAIRRLGDIRAAFLSGIFCGHATLPVDILLVGKVNLNRLADFLEAALSGVMSRGGAKPGDKTMIDALHPAALKAREVAALPLSEAASAVTAAAESGLEATRSMRAAVGRAKALGEASIGYQDAGAVSVRAMLEALRDYTLAQADRPI